ncbi:MAG: hypothetical protein SX243_05280 [Acidobacteriota bacterium]|nr:hypothetical protein [Acidobacteriota bacterium]
MAKRKAFLLRIDPRLYDALHRWADDELRSVNGQIEYLLRDQLKRAGRLPKRRPPADSPSAPDDGAEEGS